MLLQTRGNALAAKTFGELFDAYRSVPGGRPEPALPQPAAAAAAAPGAAAGVGVGALSELSTSVSPASSWSSASSSAGESAAAGEPSPATLLVRHLREQKLAASAAAVRRLAREDFDLWWGALELSPLYLLKFHGSTPLAKVRPTRRLLPVARTHARTRCERSTQTLETLAFVFRPPRIISRHSVRVSVRWCVRACMRMHAHAR